MLGSKQQILQMKLTRRSTFSHSGRRRTDVLQSRMNHFGWNVFLAPFRLCPRFIQLVWLMFRQKSPPNPQLSATIAMHNGFNGSSNSRTGKYLKAWKRVPKGGEHFLTE